MNQKDLIKYGLLALGAYLIYRYIQDHGGIEGLLGTATVPVPHPAATGTTATGTVTGTTPATSPAHIATIQPKPGVLDLTGLVTRPDVNDSLTGTVKINGVPTILSIITGTGQIFGADGQEVTTILVSKGVDVDALRTAFTAAQGLSGLGAMIRFTPVWLM